MKKNRTIIMLALVMLYALPVQAKVKSYVVEVENSNYIYNLGDLQTSFINYKIGIGDTSLYDEFKRNIGQGKFVAFQDESEKYVNYQNIVDTYMQSKLEGKSFNIDKFIENAPEVQLKLENNKDSNSSATKKDKANEQNENSKSDTISNSSDITVKFTDVNFRNAVYKVIGKNNSQPILYSDVKNIKSLNVAIKEIGSLNGIEYFTNLTKLDCYYNNLVTLNLNQNTALVELNCFSNKLTSLNISKNTDLSMLDCHTNFLENLDISKNTALTKVDCAHNMLTSLDISKNIDLVELDCSYNEFYTLDIDNNTALENLSYDKYAVKLLPLTIESIDDISITVKKNMNYMLPNTVIVTMSDKSTKSVNVIWNSTKVDTSKIGTSTFKGYVSEYGLEVELTLSVVNEISLKEFEDYLNKSYSVLNTPIGKLHFEHSIIENDNVIFPEDFQIHTDWSGFSPYDFKYSIKISEEDKEKIKELLRQYQQNIAKEAFENFPNKKIRGGFYSGYYKYPYLEVGYDSTKFLSWINYNYDLYTASDYDNTYITSFRWFNEYDEYDFTE